MSSATTLAPLSFSAASMNGCQPLTAARRAARRSSVAEVRESAAADSAPAIPGDPASPDRNLKDTRKYNMLDYVTGITSRRFGIV